MTPSRPATLADLAVICAVEAACFGPGEGFSTRQVRNLLACPTARWWIIDDLAVSCWLRVSNGRRAWARLYSLAVHPGARGRGLASQLLAEGFQWMAAEGLVRCFAEVAADNAPARALYHRHGFTERHVLPHYYGFGQDGVSLLKELLAPVSAPTAPYRRRGTRG